MRQFTILRLNSRYLLSCLTKTNHTETNHGIYAKNVQAIAVLLFLTVTTQVIYTALYAGASDVPRLWLWGLEGVVFVFLTAIAGSALVQAKNCTLGFSAILASAILNIIQVGVGFTQFGAFRETAQTLEAIGPAAGSVVAYSFFVYNGAKILLGIAALVFGMAVLKTGSTVLGRLTIILGFVAIVTNAISMMFGRIEVIPSGAMGVVATLMLAVCLLKLRPED